MKELDLNGIIQIPGFKNYFPQKFAKKQIYLHHTAGPNNPKLVFDYWNTKQDHVATCVVLGQSGSIFQGFPSECWAHHASAGTYIHQISIGIEICSWGALTKKGDKFYSYTNTEVPAENVVTYDKPFRGSRYFEKYTPEQIEAVRQLLVFWSRKFGIPLNFRMEIFDICHDAQAGVPGVYTHCSITQQKSDIHPQPEMIAMLQSLTA